MKKFIFLLSFCFCAICASAQCTMVCYNQVDFSLDSNGEVTVTPYMVLADTTITCPVEIGLFDAFNGTQLLPFADDITMDCGLIGSYVYEVREVGGGGNSCWAGINIVDVDQVCEINIGPDSLGIIYTLQNGGALFSAQTTLNGSPVEEIYPWLDVIAEADLLIGENVLDFGTTSNPSPLNGISSLDVVVGQKQLLEIEAADPLKAILADVDNSGFLGVNDLMLLRQLILGIIPDLPAPNYAYFSNTYSFASNFDIFDFTSENFREYRFDKDEVTQEDLYFNVYPIGDINEAVLPDSLSSGIASNRSSKHLVITDNAVQKGELVQVPIRLDAEDLNINGLQLSLNLENLSLQNVIDNYSGSQLVYNEVSDSDLRFSFVDDAETQYFDVTLELEALEDGMLSNMITLNTDFENIVVSYTAHSDIDISFEQSSSVDEVLEVKGNVLSNQLEINLPIDHTDVIQVFDLQGKLISTHLPSAHKVILNRNNFPTSGMYIIGTISDGKRIAKKLIVI